MHMEATSDEMTETTWVGTYKGGIRNGSPMEPGDVVQCLYCMGIAHVTSDLRVSDHWYGGDGEERGYCSVSRLEARGDFLLAYNGTEEWRQPEWFDDPAHEDLDVLPVFYVEERRVVVVAAANAKEARAKYAAMPLEARKAWTTDGGVTVRSEDEVMKEVSRWTKP